MKIIVCPKCKTPYSDSEKCCPNCGEAGVVKSKSVKIKISDEQRKFFWTVICGLGFHIITIFWILLVRDCNFLGNYYESDFWIKMIPYVLIDSLALYVYGNFSKKEQNNISYYYVLIVLAVSCGYYMSGSISFLSEIVKSTYSYSYDISFNYAHISSSFRCFLWSSAFAFAIKEIKDKNITNRPFYIAVASIIADCVRWGAAGFDIFII